MPNCSKVIPASWGTSKLLFELFAHALDLLLNPFDPPFLGFILPLIDTEQDLLEFFDAAASI